jgi:hypothetical protein
MADAFVIELNHFTAGIAVRERGGYRFYASDDLFLTIDARKFRRVRDVSTAARRIADEAGRPARSVTRTGISRPPDLAVAIQLG